MGRIRVELPEEVEELRVRISAWRSSKTSSVERMPRELWAEAVGLASHFGVSAVSRGLGIGYAGLRQRLGEIGEPLLKTGVRGEDFVELGTWAGCGPMRMEVQHANGSRLRLEGIQGASNEAALLLRIFLGEG